MNQSESSLPRSRRRVRFLAATVVAGAMMLGFQQPAMAATGNPAPPSPAYAAPPATSVIATGTGFNFWASDYCHYFAQAGWRSDLCMRQLVDADGNLLNKIGMFQNLGNGQLGREMIRVDYSDPTYIVSGFLVLPGGEKWVQSRKDNPSHIEVAVYDAARGTWSWQVVEGRTSEYGIVVGGGPIVTGTPITAADLAGVPPALAQSVLDSQMCSAARWLDMVCVYGVR